MPYLDCSTVALGAVTTFSILLYLHRDHSNLPVRAGHHLWIETELSRERLCSVYPADPSMSLLPGLGLGVGIQSTGKPTTQKGTGLTFCSTHLMKSPCLEYPTGCFRNSMRFSSRDSKAAGSDLIKGQPKVEPLGPFQIWKEQNIMFHFHWEVFRGWRISPQLVMPDHRPTNQESRKINLLSNYC